MVATRRYERRLVSIALHQFEAEHAAIEGESAFKVRDFQVHMSDANAWTDGMRRQRRFRVAEPIFAAAKCTGLRGHDGFLQLGRHRIFDPHHWSMVAYRGSSRFGTG